MSFHEDPGSLFWSERPAADWRDVLALAGQDSSGRLLRGACAKQLGISQLRHVKVEIARMLAEGATLSALRPVRVGLVGSGNLDFLADMVPGTAPRFGLRAEVAPSIYNSIASAAFIAPDFDGPVDVVAIIPDLGAFPLPGALADRAAHDAAIADAAAHLERIVDTVRAKTGSAIVLATVPGMPDMMGATGDRAIPGTTARFLADLNAGIVEIAETSGVVLWDLEQIAAAVGLRHWRNPVAAHVAKSPFSIDLAPLIADRLCATLAAMFGKSRRALVLDLDNTVWSGVIGDDGLSGINIGQGDAVGESHLAVQRFALELRRRGIVLAVCSKNDEAVARIPFRDHPDMLLREEHFAVFQANWNDKATNIQSIADALALNVDSLVFLDDNPAERARVRQQFPEVAVPELPDDAAYYVASLAAGGYFETTKLGADDLGRADAYQGNAKRAEIRQKVGDYDSYLTSLAMVLEVRRFDEVGRSRIAQLINKSNQFNLTTRRRQEADVAAVEAADDMIGLQFRLTDTFGDNGMICVIVLRVEGEVALIDTWLMSCRVLERGVEQAVLNEIVDAAAMAGATRVVGEYLPTERNAMVRDHYERLGFSPIDVDDGDGGSRWSLDISNYEPRLVRMDIVHG
ncbi:MAG: Haloacid dehalogenase [Bradyrhizobium sp.]|nr:Haloacid dehalogenase [Bradyrhizobium sp.]